MRLSKFFTLDEFCVSQTAARYGISMNPPPHVIDNLKLLCVNVLDPVRAHFNRPVVISSGYRPPQLNSLVKGSARSQHLTGQAADFNVPGLHVTEVCKAVIALRLPFDQLIWEFGAWTHVSYSGTRRRGEVLTARRNGNKVVYDTGLPN